MENRQILSIIADNPSLFETLKGVLTEKFDVALSQLKTQNFTNETLGEAVRAQIDGLRAVEEGFREIEKYRTGEKKEERINPAR